MFSKRFPGHLHPNRLAGILAAKRKQREKVLDLTESNPTRVGLSYPQKDIIEAFTQPGIMEYHPDPRGDRTARRAVAGYYRERGLDVDPGRIFLTAGTSEAYSHIFKLLADPGDEILVPYPSYPLLDSLAGLEMLRVVRYPLFYDTSGGWHIDLETMRNSVSTRTRAILTVNPNNPTGSFVNRDELTGINEICASFDLAHITDEVFWDYPGKNLPDDVVAAAGGHDSLTFALGGLSKIVCLPQVKLGWMMISGPEELVNNALVRLEFIADAYLSAGTPVQLAAPGLLGLGRLIREQVVSRVEKNQEILVETLQIGCGVKMLRRDGGWYAVLKADGQTFDEDFACRLLEEADVYVHPGYFYDFAGDGFLVLSLLTRPEVFREGVRRLAG